ncbi:hypothetical protein ACRAWF_41160 [Streptomyces sp. L7]
MRVPDGNRIELRGGDGAANPYLAAAAALAAGLDGIERGLDPGEPGATGKGPELPPTLLHAARGAPGGRRGQRCPGRGRDRA